ncbi:substrate-binding domain-containing protein [Kribbella deserti]|uniref:Substrate-binding domain-containing protein n=1 Tax=Kribbella deserti TaxID=1926257 RepID=A0ABV6QJY5_9ACTN
MLAQERHDLILENLRQHGRLRVGELATELGVSVITIRRDLGELDALGLLRRVHGGAVGLGPDADVAPAGGQRTIGIVVPNATFYYTDAIRGAERVADRYGARLVLGVSGYDQTVESERIGKLLDLGVTGILLSTALGDGQADQLGDLLDNLAVPVVLMERSFGFPHVSRELDHVRTDHAYGAMVALRHLASLGHRRIGVSLSESVTSYWLRRGVEQAAGPLGVEAFVSATPLPRVGEDPASIAQLDDFLAECEDFGAKAILAHSDEDAARLAERAMERGLRIPQDLALVAYNDETAALALVPMTAVSPPKLAIGRIACELLLRRLTADERLPTQHLSLLPELRIRESCGALNDDRF